jgi:hypothetical protein
MKRRKPINRPEQALQRACVGLLERFYEPMPDVFWTAINPVPAKSRAVAGISKAMGLRPGVPDFIFIKEGWQETDAAGNECYFPAVMVIEFKAPDEPGGKKASLSGEQKKIFIRLQSLHVHTQMVNSVERFVSALENFGIFPKRPFTLKTEPAKPKRPLSPPGKYRW